MEQSFLFDLEPSDKPLSENSRLATLESLTKVAELGSVEKEPHVRRAMKEYFDQLVALLGPVEREPEE